MGSFVGHIDEALFFILLALWWMWNSFSRHITSQWDQTEFTARISYRLPGKRKVPLEAILKTVFPMAGFIGEVISQGLPLIDEDGNFRKLESIQHMSIYAIFIVHGIIDILMNYGAPLPKHLDYLSAMAAFGWYGLSFSFHAHMHGKEAIETMIHILPIYVMYAVPVAGVFEMCLPHCFTPVIARIYFLLVLGTWFTQAAFIMYLPYPWPGSDKNPAWDQSDERNVHFIVALFGFHLIMHLGTITLGYLGINFLLRVVRARGGRNQFRPLLSKADEADADVA